MEALDLIRITVSFFILAIASISDWKTRTVSDSYWIFLGSTALIALFCEILMSGLDILYSIYLIPLAVIFYDLFWERRGIFEDGINVVPLFLYILSLLIVIYLLIEFWYDSFMWHLMTVVLMFGIIILFYQLDIIKGGADAKALLALSIMFPMYPTVHTLPIIEIPNQINEIIFPFSLLILFNAALLTISVPISLFIYNLAKGDRKFPVMFFGYKEKVENVRFKFVWPLEFIEENKRRLSLFPKASDSSEFDVEAFRRMGVEKIWVTPKIPFLIPITVSLVVSSVIGNPIFLLTS